MSFIFKSILDDDLYKYTMQQAILKQYPDAVAKYRFINRGPQKFNQEFIRALKDSIKLMAELRLWDSEKEWMSKLGFFAPWYIDFLSTYKYDPSEVSVDLNNGDLVLEINANWYRGVLWEVKLMALISQLYFSIVETNWSYDDFNSATAKGRALEDNLCTFADFGTRRRRSFNTQDMVVGDLKSFSKFAGTSNMHLAFKYGLRPIGTMAHEWVQAISVLESLNHPNRFMLQKWADVYEGSLGIALTDTYGTDSFFRDFSTRYSKLFDGVRHDSGCPFIFTDNAVAHYINKKMDPSTKTIVFSDGLDVNKAIEISNYCKIKRIKCSFGIGTHLTNDFKNSPALNIVIKLISMNNKHVVKLSDVAGKETGDPETVEMMRKIHGR